MKKNNQHNSKIKGLFSLVITTMGNRKTEFQRLIKSINEQEYQDIEIIVVNQGGSKSTYKIAEISNRKYKIVDVPVVSLSMARNIGNKYAKGEFVAYPDDDCWYERNVLQKAYNHFQEDIDCICCPVYDPNQNKYYNSSIIKKYNDMRDKILVKTINAARYSTSVGFFCRNYNMRFDEALGVAAKWGAGEDLDYILRLIKLQKKVFFYTDLMVYHPYVNISSDEQVLKMHKYAMGAGIATKKAFCRGQFTIMFPYIVLMLRSICGVVWYLLKRDKRYKIYVMRIKGLIKGFIGK